MHHIFNSLGSNYNAHVLWHALSFQKNDAQKKAQAALLNHFGGEIFFYYKGRDAIAAALLGLGIEKRAVVLTQAFSCYAVEEGIKTAGAEAQYYDVEKHSIRPSKKTVLEAIKKSSTPPKAIILQYTLGYSSSEDEEIITYCRKQNILIIEDLAQAFGGMFTDHSPVGSKADAVVLSFGKDKILDAVSGGAVVFPHMFFHEKLPQTTTGSVLTTAKDTIYPFLSVFIRNTYGWGVGKICHVLGKRLGLFPNPIKTIFPAFQQLKAFYFNLVVFQLSHLSLQLTHRKNIAKLYNEHLKKYSPVTLEHIHKGSNLRYPILVENPSKLLEYLEQQGIHISDRWYRKAVDMGPFSFPTSYVQGSCPTAEDLAQHIVNLPTHLHISPSDAEHISRKVLEWIH